jgi:Phage minor capsid protein 2
MNQDQLIQYIQDVAEEIYGYVINANDLLNDAKFQELQRMIEEILAQLGTTIEEVVPAQVIASYFGGVNTASSLLAAQGVAVTGGLALTASGQIARGFQTKIHMEAVEVLMQDTLSDMRAAVRTAQQSAIGNITQTLTEVKRDITAGLIAGDPSKVVSKRVAKSFAQNGLTSFVTSDNKRLPLDVYSNLVARTKFKQANLTGAVNRYEENEVTLVKVSGNTPTCSKCAAYRDQVFSLTGEHEGFVHLDVRKVFPLHPHCRCSLQSWVIQYKTPEEIEKAKQLAKSFNPQKDKRSKSQQAAYKKQQDIRRKANDEKKQFARWRGLLGDDMYKTIGAFRRGKRQNSVKFQELQSEYMSLSQQIRRGT